MGLAKRINVCVVDCPRCGEVFGMTEATVHIRRRDGRTFYCPLGHPMSFPLNETLQQRELREAKLQAKRAEEELARQRQAREWAEKRAKGANIAAGMAKAAANRLKHRVECGVCPRCQRTFKQLAAHMKSKHAEQL